MTENIKITWYRCKVDKALMSELMKKSDARAFLQVIPSLGLFALTGTLAYLAFQHLHASNWPTALPLLLLALFAHGTHASFFGGIACHEFCHKTPFATQSFNTFFLYVYSFLGWFDPTGYRASHVRHHQVTVHSEHDGEIVQPLGLDWRGLKFFVTVLTFSPTGFFKLMRFWVCAAFNNFRYDGFLNAKWFQRVVPETDEKGRRAVRNWARVMVLGHLALATAFILTGHWFLIVIVNFGAMYCVWFVFVCGAAQHVGLQSDVPDFRLNTRSYTCGWFPAFCYWNMQYHVEHHMFPAVPFYNLPRLREAIKHDLPPASHGLWPLWRDELLPIMRRQHKDPSYRHVQPLPSNEGDRATDTTLLSEAAQS